MILTNQNKRTFIHYGHSNYDPKLFTSINNKNSPRNKPGGGLWACDVKTNFGWKEWCLAEEFYPKDSPKLNDYFTFKLKKGARVLQLITPEDFDLLPILWSEFEEESSHNPYMNKEIDKFYYVDWKAIKESRIDAIEYIRTPYGHDVFYTWDFDSIVILNQNAITHVQNSKKKGENQ